MHAPSTIPVHTGEGPPVLPVMHIDWLGVEGLDEIRQEHTSVSCGGYVPGDLFVLDGFGVQVLDWGVDDLHADRVGRDVVQRDQSVSVVVHLDSVLIGWAPVRATAPFKDAPMVVPLELHWTTARSAIFMRPSTFVRELHCDYLVVADHAWGLVRQLLVPKPLDGGCNLGHPCFEKFPFAPLDEAVQGDGPT